MWALHLAAIEWKIEQTVRVVYTVAVHNDLQSVSRDLVCRAMRLVCSEFKWSDLVNDDGQRLLNKYITRLQDQPDRTLEEHLLDMLKEQSGPWLPKTGCACACALCAQVRAPADLTSLCSKLVG